MTHELILLATEIPDHADSYARTLRAHGFRVEVVGTGAEALQFATQSAPDLGVFDVRLPDMTGWELCSSIKEQPAAALPIVILTDDLSVTCAESSARSGCHAWLARPTRAEDLVRIVRDVLVLDQDVPSSVDAALLGINSCPACHGTRLKATLRMSPIQYYRCQDCGLSWRIDTVPA
jgi:CheY-like chemotaxis protein